MGGPLAPRAATSRESALRGLTAGDSARALGSSEGPRRGYRQAAGGPVNGTTRREATRAPGKARPLTCMPEADGRTPSGRAGARRRFQSGHGEPLPGSAVRHNRSSRPE